MRADNGKFILSKQEVTCMLQFAVKDETRPHMLGLHFVPAKGTVEATDGHAAIRANSMATADAPSFLAPRKVLEMATKLASTAHHAIEVSCQDGEVTANVLDTDKGDKRIASAYEDAADGEFPDLDVVTPAPESLGDVNYNIDPKFHTQIGEMRKAGVDRVKCHGQAGKNGPVVYTADGEDTTYTIVVMPMRDKD
jgi:hypothetical protein